MEKNKDIHIRFKLKQPKASHSLLLAKIQFAYLEKTERQKRVEEVKEIMEKHPRLIKAAVHNVYRVPKGKRIYVPVIVSTGLSLPTEFFNVEAQYCGGTYDHFNQSLDLIKDSIQRLYISLLKNELQEITPSFLKEQIKRHVFKKHHGKNASLILTETPLIEDKFNGEYFVDYIKWKMDQFVSLGQRNEKTIVAYNKFRNHVLEFEKYLFGEKSDQHIAMSQINNALLKTAVAWFLTLINPKSISKKVPAGKPYSLNYNDWWKRTWKLFLNEAQNEDDIEFEKLNLDKKFLNRKSETADDFYLKFSELKAIKNLVFDQEEEQLEKCRDSFIINCACACRWSDFQHQKKLFQDDDGIWYFVIQKTVKNKTVNVQIPVLDKDVLTIYKKYNNTIPLMGTAKDYNDKINIICMRAGITEMYIAMTLNPKTLKLESKEPVPKYTLCTSKTARKTGISNWVREYNIPLPIAMSWSNHQSEDSFRVYLKIEDPEYYKMTSKIMSKLNYA